jgi:hypothetical protein
MKLTELILEALSPEIALKNLCSKLAKEVMQTSRGQEAEGEVVNLIFDIPVTFESNARAGAFPNTVEGVNEFLQAELKGLSTRYREVIQMVTDRWNEYIKSDEGFVDML